VGGGRYWFDAEGPWAFNFALRTDVLQLSETDDHCPIGGLLGFTYFPRLFSLPEPPPPPPPPAEYELTVEKRGNCAAGGTVTSNPAGIDCGADCAATYVEGTAVTLTAREGDGCTFDGWTGDADCADGSVTMNGDRMCVANFSEIPPPPPPAPPKMTEVERTCVFDSGSARVNNPCKAILDEVALLMKDNPEAPALVIGYSDSQGSEASNTRTGQRRAESVKNWLVTRHAIDPSRITVESRGEADPVGDNATAAGRKANRRAVIRITVEEDMM
jgi:outer membrane protein OmpA-like peptidoglycan-associated protein